MAGRQVNFKCVKSHCLHLSFASYKRYLTHVRDYHVHEPNFEIKCPVYSCFRSYSLLASLTSHIRRKHGEVDCDKDINGYITQDDGCQVSFETSDPVHCNEKTMEHNTHDISVKEMALFALKTQEFNRLSDTATDAILESTYQLLEQNQEHLKAQVKKCIGSTGLDLKDIEGLEELLDSQHTVTASMRQLKTPRERNRYLRDTFKMVVSSATDNS